MAALPIAGRSYQLRWRVARATDPPDPFNDSVTLGIRWLDGSKAGLSTTTVENIPLTVAMGVVDRAATVGPAGIAGIDHLPPVGAVYFRAFVQAYGDAHRTDVLTLEADDATGVLSMIDTLAGLELLTVPLGVERVLIERYDTASLDAPAWYKRVASDPGVPMARQDAGGAWFVLVEDPATPEMAGALGDNTGDDAPAFSRLLQSGDRLIRATPGATYRIAQDGTTRQAMRNDGAAFDTITLDLTGAVIILSCDAGVDDYASYLDVRGTWRNFNLIGGTYKLSTRPYLYGIVTAKGVGATPDDMWFEFRRSPNLPHPAWTDQSIRVIDRYDPETREFFSRVTGNASTDVGGTGLRSTPGFPLTRPGGTDLYRVDMRNAQLSVGEPPNEYILPTPTELRNRIHEGELIAVQHRRDTARGFSFGRTEHDGASCLTMTDVTIHGCESVGVRPFAVDSGKIVRLRIVPEDELDVYTTNSGGFRIQDCRGTWSFDDCWIVSSGDDAFMSYAGSQRITDTPATDLTLTSNQLRLVATSAATKPLIGDIVQLRDWAAGVVDETDTWKVTAIGPEVGEANPYVMTLDKPVNPAWTPTGTTAVILPPDDDDPGGVDLIVVGDGTGWALDTTAAPVIISSGGMVARNRGNGWVATHVGAGSQINMDWAIDCALAAVAVGNQYPATLNGMIPRNVSVHIGLIDGGQYFSGVLLGGYKGNTRDEAASEGYVRDVHVVIDAVRDIPRGFAELRGASNCDVTVGSSTKFALNPNDEIPRSFRAIYGGNVGNSQFDGGAIAALSRWDVLFDGASHDNVIVSPARARNWLDNAEFRQSCPWHQRIGHDADDNFRPLAGCSRHRQLDGIAAGWVWRCRVLHAGAARRGHYANSRRVFRTATAGRLCAGTARPVDRRLFPGACRRRFPGYSRGITGRLFQRHGLRRNVEHPRPDDRRADRRHDGRGWMRCRRLARQRTARCTIM